MDKTEKFFEDQKSMSDTELYECTRDGLSKLCMSGGSSLTMHVPPRIDDFDMLVSELLRRFKNTIE